MSNLNFNGGSNSLAFNLNINGTTVASTPGGSFQEQATTLSGSTTITGTGSVMSITVLVHGSILSAVSSTITGSLFAIAAKR